MKGSAGKGLDDADLVIFGGTPGGIAAAVRAARNGQRVLLLSISPHLGGMLTSGLGVMDTLFDGSRAPVLDEFVQGVLDDYAERYGKHSRQYADCYGERRVRFEPQVAERVFNKLLSAEPGISLISGVYPVAVVRAERRLRAVVVRSLEDESERTISARCFIDASYEGDLLAAAGTAYNVGRESREAYGEPHAGRIFSTHGHGPFPREAKAGRLNLGLFPVLSQELFAGSTGEGDHAIQSYNFRFCLSRNPDNRRYPAKPDSYDRSVYLGIVQDQETNLLQSYPLKSQLLLDDVNKHRISPVTSSMPNDKISWNEPNLTAGNHAYPTADWPERREMIRRHRDHALGLLYFLQNDEAVPEHVREDARQWGLAEDEFTDNELIPYEMYVREARRLAGRYVFTEHDGSLARGILRTPVHYDSVGIAEWPMDSHECTLDRQFGSLGDGKFLLTEKTRPSQIPYRCLLPQDIDNLLVPVCVSSTHVGWGTLRLEPVWMQLGEAAAHACSLALEQGATPGALAPETLQRRLVERGMLLSFFNDHDMKTAEPWVAAVQYLSTKGFFADYETRAGEPLTLPVMKLWCRFAASLAAGEADAGRQAEAVYAAAREEDGASSATFGQLLRQLRTEWSYREWPEGRLASLTEELADRTARVVTRGEACLLLYELLAP